jgi:hypothetical protein
MQAVSREAYLLLQSQALQVTPAQHSWSVPSQPRPALQTLRRERAQQLFAPAHAHAPPSSTTRP